MCPFLKANEAIMACFNRSIYTIFLNTFVLSLLRDLCDKFFIYNRLSPDYRYPYIKEILAKYIEIQVFAHSFLAPK